MNTDLIQLSTAADDDSFDDHRNLPKPDPVCLYGLIGQAAEAGSEGSEANRFAIAANVIAYLSAAIGRAPYLPVGDTKHHARLFLLHVGRSGLGRKGDSAALVTRIDAALQKLEPNVAPQIHSGGLSSKEGLITLIQDSYGDGEDTVAGVEDKRLLVRESEFANVLQQQRRSGNTLSMALRDGWDGVDMKPATRTKPLGVTAPHISIAAAVTPSELRAMLVKQDLTNGFANRFLIFWAEREGQEPFPKATDQETVDFIARDMKHVIEFCRGHCPGQNDTMLMTFSPDAAQLYAKLYRGELEDRTHGDRINSLLERRAPMLLRLAMIFALTDLKTIIEVNHIYVALAWVRYYVDSVKFIFASGADEAKVAEVQEAAEKILVYLSEHGKSTRTELTRDCFKNHTPREVIDCALDELLQHSPPHIRMDEYRTKGAARATKAYELVTTVAANSAKSANFEQPCGLQEICPDCEPCEVSDVSDFEHEEVRKVRKTSHNPDETEMVDEPEISQSTQNAQAFEDILEEPL